MFVVEYFAVNALKMFNIMKCGMWETFCRAFG